jgi:hypothetical protein
VSIPGSATELCETTGPQATDLEGVLKPTSQFLAGARALDFFSQGLRQHVLVEREVGHEPFSSAVFFLQLSEPPQFAHAQMGVVLLPGIEGRVTDAELPTEITDFDLPDRVHDLLLGEL